MQPDFTPGLPPPDEPAPAKSNPAATIAMIAGLCFAALSFIVFGIGYALGEWGGGDDEDEVAAAPSEEPEEPKPEEPGEPKPVLLGAEDTPTLENTPTPKALEEVEGPLPGAEPVPEYMPPGFKAGGGDSGGSGASGGGGSTGAAGGGGDPSKSARVSVTVVLRNYKQVDVKLGGKVFHLEGEKTIKIRPGGYRVELRKSPEDPWKSAGLIEVDIGKKYKATLIDPPLVQLQTL